MSVYRLLALRYLLQRWDRGALIIASIALGVATLVSASVPLVQIPSCITDALPS